MTVAVNSVIPEAANVHLLSLVTDGSFVRNLLIKIFETNGLKENNTILNAIIIQSSNSA